MTKIRIAYADMWPGFDYNIFPLEKILSKEYEIIHDNENPDLVICGPFGLEYLKYDCVRLELLAEALSPDFNLYDYAIGFDYIEFEDRYLRMPLYMFDTEAVKLARGKHLREDSFYDNKTKFCNFIVSNPDAMKERELFFDKLNARRHVDSAGGFKNNMPNGERCDNLITYREPYRFTLAFENSLMDGYVTEKIMYAFAAGTVPIYYGGNQIEREINEKSFIDVSKFKSMEECIDYILYVDDHSEEYLKIARQPVFLKEIDYEQRLLDFFKNIVSNKNEYRRISKKTVYGRIYEEKRRKVYNRRTPWWARK